MFSSWPKAYWINPINLGKVKIVQYFLILHRLNVIQIYTTVVFCYAAKVLFKCVVTFVCQILRLYYLMICVTVRQVSLTKCIS